MKRLSFKEWLYKPDEEGATGEMVVVFSCLIPIISFVLASINSGFIDFSIIPIALIIQILFLVVYYLFDSRVR